MATTLTRRARQTLDRCEGCTYEPVVLARKELALALTHGADPRGIDARRNRLLAAIAEAERIGGSIGRAIDMVTGREAEREAARAAREAAQRSEQAAREARELDDIYARLQAVLAHPCRRVKARIDAAKITRERMCAVLIYDYRRTLRRALVETVAYALTRHGWQQEHRSRVHGGCSLYLTREGITVRISDHDIPDTPERVYYREELGRRTAWDIELIVRVYDTVESLLAEVAEQVNNLNAD